MTRVQSPILVGRADALARIDEALARAIAGAPSVVVVEGEAGIGKSRLVEEFLIAADARHGVRGLVGGCLDIGGSAAPFAPYLELLRKLRRAGDGEGPATSLEVHATALAPLVGGTSDATEAGDEEVRRARLFGAVLDVLRETASNRPVALVIEDVHWADRSTLELTGFLARTLRGSPVVPIVTLRTDERRRDAGRDDLLAAFLTDHATTRIQLARLDVDEVRAQLEAIVGGPVSRAMVASIHARSGGNPYLAEELVALAVDGDPVGLPPAPRDIVLARLATMAPEEQRVVNATAIGGPSVEVDRLAAVTGLSEVALHAALRASFDSAILVRQVDPDGAERVALRHALGREAVEADLLASERRMWHARWAETLVAIDADGQTAEIARHWDLGGHPDLAVPYLLREAADAASRLAFDSAARAYERALAILDMARPDVDLESIDMVAMLGRAAAAMQLCGRHPDSVRLAERQLAAIPEDDAVARAAALERIGTYRMDAGDNEGSIEATAHAVRLLHGGSPAASARVLISSIVSRAHVLRLDGTLDDCEEAIRLAQEAGRPELESIASCQRGLIRTWLGDIDEGEVDLARAMDLALATGDLEATLLAALDRPITEDARGRFDRAFGCQLDGIELVRTRGGIHSFEAIGLVVGAASMAEILGRWREADRLLDEADELEVLERDLHGTSATKARLACGRGDLERAKAELARPQVGAGPQIDVDHAIVAAQVARLDGRPAEAVATTIGALELTAPLETFLGRRQTAEIASIGIAAAADLGAASGRASADPAPPDTEALVAALERSGPGAGAPRDPVRDAWVAQARADLARGASRPEPASWTDVADRWTRLGCRELEGWARLREGESIVLARGDRAAAAATLRAALAIAEDLGAMPLRSEIEGLIRRARIRGAGSSSAGPAASRPAAYGLTSREREVLDLIADGKSNRQIADTLFLSPKTASVHVSSILGKLGVRGRVEAATLALREGLVRK